MKKLWIWLGVKMGYLTAVDGLRYVTGDKLGTVEIVMDGPVGSVSYTCLKKEWI